MSESSLPSKLLIPPTRSKRQLLELVIDANSLVENIDISVMDNRSLSINFNYQGVWRDDSVKGWKEQLFSESLWAKHRGEWIRRSAYSNEVKDQLNDSKLFVQSLEDGCLLGYGNNFPKESKFSFHCLGRRTCSPNTLLPDCFAIATRSCETSAEMSS